MGEVGAARARLLRTTIDLLRADTGVPANATGPDADAVAVAVREVVEPMLEELGPHEIRRHPNGDVAARYGPDTPDGLVLMGYVVAQHGDPDDRRVELDGDGARLRGRGVAQCKGGLGAGLDALDRLDSERLRRPVWMCINTEGFSSHGGSRRILGDLGVHGHAGVILSGTDLDVSVANRGRVDLHVVISGRGGHSSRPEDLANPVDGLGEVLARVAAVPRPPDDPRLGAAAATVYGFRVEPVAPHTVPDRIEVVVDRRLLPGEDPDTIAGSYAEQLAGPLGDGLDVQVEAGAWMLPAEVEVHEPVVTALRSAVEATGRRCEVVVSRHTFDAGWACSRGVPTVMFGPGRRSFGHDVTATEEVAVEDLVAARDALVGLATALCVR